MTDTSTASDEHTNFSRLTPKGSLRIQMSSICTPSRLLNTSKDSHSYDNGKWMRYLHISKYCRTPTLRFIINDLIDVKSMPGTLYSWFMFNILNFARYCSILMRLKSTVNSEDLYLTLAPFIYCFSCQHCVANTNRMISGVILNVGYVTQANNSKWVFLNRKIATMIKYINKTWHYKTFIPSFASIGGNTHFVGRDGQSSFGLSTKTFFFQGILKDKFRKQNQQISESRKYGTHGIHLNINTFQTSAGNLNCQTNTDHWLILK